MAASSLRSSKEARWGSGRTRRPGRTARRWWRRLLPALSVVAVALGALALVGLLGYFTVTAVQARRALLQAKDDVAAVKADLIAGHRLASERDLAAAQRATATAADRTTGRLWAGAAAIPVVGAPLDTVRGIASTAHELTSRVLPDVVTAAVAMSPDRLRASGDRIDLTALQQAAPALTRADASATRAARTLQGLPAGWLPAVRHARQQFLDLMTELRTTLGTTSVAARLVPPMLGADGPRRYLLVFENDAEARGLGGLPGAFAILRVSHGKIRFERFGNDTEIRSGATVDLGGEFGQRYGGLGVDKLFENSDMSPHFPDAAQIWMSMWQHKTGQRLDGALATDPTALSYLLRVTGPAKLADGTKVTADNVVALTQSTAYARFRNVAARKAFVVEIAKAVARHVLGGVGGHAQAITQALGSAAGQRRLLVWSAHPTEQALLAEFPLAGLLPRTTAPFTALTVDNAAGDKLDYYLDRSLLWSPGVCRDHRRTVTVTVTLHNTAPPTGLPRYVTVRSDHPTPRPPTGTNRSMVSLYATDGARLSSSTLDGLPVQPGAGVERGHPVFTFFVETKPNQTRTLRFVLDEPAVHGQVQTVQQPLVRPLTQTVLPTIC